MRIIDGFVWGEMHSQVGSFSDETTIVGEMEEGDWNGSRRLGQFGRSLEDA